MLLYDRAAQFSPFAALTGLEAAIRETARITEEQVLFAAGCSREGIERGAEQLGWELDKLLTMTLEAMKATEDEINAEMEKEA